MKYRLISLISLFFSYSVITVAAEDLKKMVKIPAGTFMMGYGKNQHKESVNAFYMDKFEVTQGDYNLLIGNNPSKNKSEKVGKEYPVTYVNWFDAVKYCNKLSEKEGLEPCYNEKTWECNFNKNGYRLPTEVEWEYACKADMSSDFYSSKLDEYANYWPEKSEYQKAMYKNGELDPNFKWDKPLPTLLPVGSKKPNKWGLYDMLGNVDEWCNDNYNHPFEKNIKKTQYKVIRGGNFQSYVSSYESSGMIKTKSNSITGFRCVRNDPSGKGNPKRMSSRLKNKLRKEDKAASITINLAKEKMTFAKNESNNMLERWKAVKSAILLLENKKQELGYVYISTERRQKLNALRSELAKLKSTLTPPVCPVIKGQDWKIPGLQIEFIYVQQGSFKMGIDNENPKNKPGELVKINNHYWIGKYELTIAEFKKFMIDTGYKEESSQLTDKGELAKNRFSMNYDQPIINIWIEDFCKELTKREEDADRLPQGYEYRIPTVGEWEFAARGGIKSKGYIYSGSNKVGEVAWYWKNSGMNELNGIWKGSFDIIEKNKCRTHPVGKKKPNELGIYDMSGNALEPCYSVSPEIYKSCPVDKSIWILAKPRICGYGGSWSANSKQCTIIFRRNNLQENSTGLRIVLAPKIEFKE